MRRTHELGFGMVDGYVLRDGRRLGAQPLAKITTALVDKLHENLSVVVEADGTKRERTTTVNHAMKSCRRAWNVALRAHPDDVPKHNPFSKMGLVDVSKPTPTATFDELQAFVAACDAAGRGVDRHRRADRLGMATARGGRVRHLLGRALPAEGPL